MSPSSPSAQRRRCGLVAFFAPVSIIGNRCSKQNDDKLRYGLRQQIVIRTTSKVSSSNPLDFCSFQIDSSTPSIWLDPFINGALTLYNVSRGESGNNNKVQFTHKYAWRTCHNVQVHDWHTVIDGASVLQSTKSNLAGLECQQGHDGHFNCLPLCHSTVIPRSVDRDMLLSFLDKDKNERTEIVFYWILLFSMSLWSPFL